MENQSWDLEIVNAENLLKIIRRSKFDDLTGLEALALARSHDWLVDLVKKLKEEKQNVSNREKRPEVVSEGKGQEGQGREGNQGQGVEPGVRDRSGSEKRKKKN